MKRFRTMNTSGKSNRCTSNTVSFLSTLGEYLTYCLCFRSGPIVRISPHEIHVNDIEFFDRLNSFQGKWNKDPFTAHQFANPGSIVGTLDHDVHRKRRMAILPFFSKQKVYALEPVITATIDKLCEKVQDYCKSGEVMPLRNAFHCFAADVVGEYCFAESGGLLDKPNFAFANMDHHQQGLKSGLRARYLPSWYMPAVRGAPQWIRQSVDPAAKHFEVWHRVSPATNEHHAPYAQFRLTRLIGSRRPSSSDGGQEKRGVLRESRSPNHFP